MIVNRQTRLVVFCLPSSHCDFHSRLSIIKTRQLTFLKAIDLTNCPDSTTCGEDGGAKAASSALVASSPACRRARSLHKIDAIIISLKCLNSLSIEQIGGTTI